MQNYNCILTCNCRMSESELSASSNCATPIVKEFCNSLVRSRNRWKWSENSPTFSCKNVTKMRRSENKLESRAMRINTQHPTRLIRERNFWESKRNRKSDILPALRPSANYAAMVLATKARRNKCPALPISHDFYFKDIFTRAFRSARPHTAESASCLFIFFNSSYTSSPNKIHNEVLEPAHIPKFTLQPLNPAAPWSLRFLQFLKLLDLNLIPLISMLMFLIYYLNVKNKIFTA